MKKFVMLILCCMFVLTFAGCTSAGSPSFKNEVVMQVVVGRSSISQNFAFPAYAEDLKLSADEEQVTNYIKALTERVANDVWRIYFLNYLATYSQNPDERFTPGESQFVINKAEYNPSSDAVEFSFQFTNKAWEYYHPSTAEEQEGFEGFVKKSFSSGLFPFSHQAEEKRVGEMYADMIKEVQVEYFTQQQVEGLDEIGFAYDYVTYHKRIHSNADSILSDAQGYHHVWKSKLSELGSQKIISIGTVNAVRGWWYLLVLALGLASVGVGALTIFLYQRKKSQKVVKKEG